LKGYIQTLPAYDSPGYITGLDGHPYAFYLADFSPADLEAGLEEWVSVEFDPDQGEIPRALNCQLLRTDQEDAAEAPPAAPVINTYSEQVPSPLLCKEGDPLPAEWEVIVVGNWLLSGDALSGPDDAKRTLRQRARALKANAVLEVAYVKPLLAGEPHQYRGRMAIVAQKDPLGTLNREDLQIDLDRQAEQELNRLVLCSGAARRHNMLLYAACLVLVCLAGLVAGYASLVTLVVVAAAITVAAQLRQDTAIEHYLTRQPLPTPNATPANDDNAGQTTLGKPAADNGC
jgi:hypothetical protein